MEINTLLAEMAEREASDLHLVAGQPPTFRVNGKLTRREGAGLDAGTLEGLLLSALPEDLRGMLEHGRQDVETTLRHGKYVFRFHAFRERGRLGAALRLVPTRVPNMDDLGLGEADFPVLHEIMRSPRGLVLVVGPTGSGKTTTIAGMIETINQTRAERIITIEDPIEYEFESKMSLITQRNVREDMANFPNALRSAFREDPDVLFIGEMRDLESMSMSLALADTGHLVFTTLHVTSATEAVKRVVEAFPESQRDLTRQTLARTLVAVVAQRLLPRADRPGRVAANEIMTASPRVRQMIAEGRTDLSVAIEAGRDKGMQTMDDALVRLFQAGTVSFETAWSHLQDKDRLQIVNEDARQPPQKE